MFLFTKNISKFHSNNHKLEIEAGRYRKIQVKEWICQLYKENIEKELHFCKNAHYLQSSELDILGFSIKYTTYFTMQG